MTRPKVFAYYFPQYHADPRNDARFEPGWTEWKLLREAGPRFTGHAQPRTPARGEEDESDPTVMAQYIELARDHGIDGFIFDYYWYENRPYLEGALDRGFLGAPNRNDLEFSLMWANHDWVDVFPSRDRRTPDPLVYNGGVTREQFEEFAKHVIARYFSQPNYTLIDGRPRFSIYEAGTLIQSLGGLDATRNALDWFDRETRAAGFAGVHIDLIIWSFAVLPSEIPIDDASSLVHALGARSASSYVWIHHLEHEADTAQVPDEWSVVGDRAFRAYEEYRDTLPVPFHPNVSVGWDSSPRCDPSQPLDAGRYPWYQPWAPSVDGFRHGLERARQFADANSGAYCEVSINAWNEWTEGSYLLPDTVHGLAYLEAIRDVFGTCVRRPANAAAEAPAR